MISRSRWVGAPVALALLGWALGAQPGAGGARLLVKPRSGLAGIGLAALHLQQKATVLP